MASDPHMILPESREPWGWQRPQRIVLVALVLVGAGILLLMWRQYPAALPENLPVTSRSITSIEELIDPNLATVSSLSRIPGVGPTLAQRIVEFREKKMPFSNGVVFKELADLRLVPGIGNKTLEKMRPWLKLQQTVPVEKNGLKPAKLIDEDAIPDDDAR